MKDYKSVYPTLRQAKTRWSNPSIVAKQGEGISHDWYKLFKKDAKAKLALSIHHSKMGQVRESVESKNNSEWIEKHKMDTIAKKTRKQIQATDESKDLIGKPTKTAETIAQKHGVSVSQIERQIQKGIDVEKEHTNSEQEAHEIARDHLDEFPDYYDRLEKMEKKAKEDVSEATKTRTRIRSKKVTKKAWQAYARKINKSDPAAVRKALVMHSRITKPVKEGYDPDKEIIKNRIDAHQEIADKISKIKGEGSAEASFHKAYVSRMKKLLKDVYEIDETVKKTKTDKRYKIMPNEKPLPPVKSPLPTPKGYERIKDKWGFNILRRIQTEDAGIPNSVGGGNIAGMPTRDSADMTPVCKAPLLQRKKFAGKTVFVVKPETFYKSQLGKRKYEHYENFLEGCDGFEEIRDFGRKYWDEPIIIENEQTGAMVFLKYGSK